MRQVVMSDLPYVIRVRETNQGRYEVAYKYLSMILNRETYEQFLKETISAEDEGDFIAIFKMFQTQ